MIVLLDTGPLGMLTNPNASPQTMAAANWLVGLLRKPNYSVLVPEIADYELRRELVRGGLTAAIAKLDALKKTAGYVPLSTRAMQQAAAFWAQVRNAGKPTAHNHALDGDMILAGQAHALLEKAGQHVVIATQNVKHLALVADAREWQTIN